MNATGLLADTRETLRLEAFRRRLVREHRLRTTPLQERAWNRLTRWSFVAVALGIPLALVIWPERARFIVPLSCSIAPWTAAALRRRIAAMAPQAPTFGAFALLHAPSRRGLLAARWLRGLPWMIWAGGCGVAFVAQRPDVFGRLPTLALATLGLTPLLVFAFAWWARIAEDHGDWTVRGLALIGFAAGTALCVVGTIGAIAGGVSGDVAGWFGAIVCAALALWLGQTTRANFWAWRARRRSPADPVGAARRVAAVLACVAWGVTIFLLLAAEPDERAAAIETVRWWAAPTALVVVVAAGASFLVEQFVWIDTMQLGAFATRSKRLTWKPSVGRVHRGTTTPGAGLWRAQWRRLREEKLSALDSILFVAISLRGPVLAGLGVTMAYSDGLGLPWAMAACTAPRLVDVNDAEIDRLHQFGRDLRDIVRHDLRALVFVAAVPTLAAGLVAGTVSGWTGPRVATLALIAAGFVLRAGLTGLSRIARRLGRVAAYGALACWWIGAPAAIGWLEPARAVPIEAIFALCIIVPGLLGIAFGPALASESSLRDERRGRASGVTAA